MLLPVVRVVQGFTAFGHTYVERETYPLDHFVAWPEETRAAALTNRRLFGFLKDEIVTAEEATDPAPAEAEPTEAEPEAPVTEQEEQPADPAEPT